MDNTKTPSEYPESTHNQKHLDWKQSSDEIITLLKKESKDSDADFISMEQLYQTMDKQTKINNIFDEALTIANEKFLYFEEKKKKIRAVTEEYELVNLDQKPITFLKTFRKNITSTLRIFSGHLQEFETQFEPFKKNFIALGKQGYKLLYLQDKRKEIKILNDYYQRSYRWITTAIEQLKKMRVVAYRKIQELESN